MRVYIDSPKNSCMFNNNNVIKFAMFISIIVSEAFTNLSKERLIMLLYKKC